MKPYNHIVYGGWSVARMVEAGVQNYDRAVMLTRLLPEERSDAGLRDGEDTRRLCLRLLLALRRERYRGRTGHWSYSFNRHVGLLQAYRAERRALAEMESSPKAKEPGQWPGSLEQNG